MLPQSAVGYQSARKTKDCQFDKKASVMSNLLAVTLVAMAAFYSCCLPMASAGCFRGDYSGECTQHKEIQYCMGLQSVLLEGTKSSRFGGY